jgi:anti-sigma B factor antagonist
LTHQAIDYDGTLQPVPGVYELREELLERAVQGRIRVVAVAGDLDMAAAPAFERALFDTVAGDEPTILDLSEVSFMDSTAIGAMLAVRRQAELKPGQFAVVCAPGSEIERTLLVMGLDSAFTIVQSRGRAAAELANA